MPEKQQVGKYEVSVAFCTPNNEDHRQRRVDVLAAWLLTKWDAERGENQHGEACAAG